MFLYVSIFLIWWSFCVLLALVPVYFALNQLHPYFFSLLTNQRKFQISLELLRVQTSKNKVLINSAAKEITSSNRCRKMPLHWLLFTPALQQNFLYFWYFGWCHVSYYTMIFEVWDLLLILTFWGQKKFSILVLSAKDLPLGRKRVPRHF